MKYLGLVLSSFLLSQTSFAVNLTHLPAEVQLRIISSLNTRDLASFSAVDFSSAALSQDSHLWKQKFIEAYHSLSLRLQEETSWQSDEPDLDSWIAQYPAQVIHWKELVKWITLYQKIVLDKKTISLSIPHFGALSHYLRSERSVLQTQTKIAHQENKKGISRNQWLQAGVANLAGTLLAAGLSPISQIASTVLYLSGSAPLALIGIKKAEIWLAHSCLSQDQRNLKKLKKELTEYRSQLHPPMGTSPLQKNELQTVVTVQDENTCQTLIENITNTAQLAQADLTYLQQDSLMKTVLEGLFPTYPFELQPESQLTEQEASFQVSEN